MTVHSARLDIERIRVSAERDAYVILEREEHAAKAAHVPQDVSAKRRALVANALLLTDTMAPDAYAAAREVMTSLGVDDRVELFQSAGHGADTARLVLHGDPIGIEFMGGYLDRLDHGGLLAVLGHEIGHCLAHSGHPNYGWALTACASATTRARRVYAMAAELTADRFGLLACRDLDAVLRVEMQMSAGRSVRSIRYDTEAYLSQCRAIAEEILATGGTAMGASHPEHYVRGYAEWLFTQTEVYQALTGEGPGSRSLDDVDVIVAKLIGLSPAAPEPVHEKIVTAVATENEPPAARAAALESKAADALRRNLSLARDALAGLAGALTTGPDTRPASDLRQDNVDEGPDPLGDDRRDLIARFEELERRSKDK